MYNQLLLSAKIGDGSYITQTTEFLRFKEYRYNINLMSVNLDYLVHKKVEIEKLGIQTQRIREGKSGYKEDSIVYQFNTRVHAELTKIGNLTTKQVLLNLDKLGLIYYYLDDGSYHKNKHFMHIYCNAFSKEDVEGLINVVYKYYPQKRCTERIDKKKDGRQYPYIYIPVVVVKEFKKDIEQFLITYDITSMLYKIGSPSTTIENISK